MAVRRIVAAMSAEDVQAARAFHQARLGVELVIDHGWIITFAAEGALRPQISIAGNGGSGSSVPDLSIKVDLVSSARAKRRPRDLRWTRSRALAGCPGVRRFHVRDPFDRLVDIRARTRSPPAPR